MQGAPQGYRDIPEEDRKRAKVFFDRGATVAGTGNYDYGIELYLQGLSFDPDAVDAHQALRDIAMKRKVSGGKPIGMFEAMKMRTARDDKQKLLNAAKLLSFDPGDTDHMVSLMEAAQRYGFYDTAMWVGPILLRANMERGKKQELSKYIALKEVYQKLQQWTRAAEAAQLALAMKPEDMNLQHEVRHLAAQQTMSEGNYEGGGSFRGSIRDMAAQQKLIIQDADIRTEDQMERLIRDAEDELKANPEEAGKISKLVDLLAKTDDPTQENRAIMILDEAYKRTKQFRFRLRQGDIRIRQLSRMERTLREKVKQNQGDRAIADEYRAFRKDRAEEELREFTLAAEAYPTQLEYQYQMARRLFELERYSEAIPVFQRARQDPKYRGDASVMLGRSFFEAGFLDEAVDTFKQITDDYPLKGDDKHTEMVYWYGRSLEAHGDKATAAKSYSQVAQVNFNYRDVQSRIKKLRAVSSTPQDRT